MDQLTAVELCAGAGGQALGLEQAGSHHEALVEIDPDCCNTLRNNRKNWNVLEQDLREFDGRPYKGVDLLAGGLPCPPFSKAGKQLGDADERNLFPEGIRLVKEIRPRAVMIENVRGILDAVFEDYRRYISGEIASLGYRTDWRLLNASDYGVPQLRPRVVFLALRGYSGWFPLARSVAFAAAHRRRYTLRFDLRQWLEDGQGLAHSRQSSSPYHRWRFLKTRWPRPWPYSRQTCMGIARR
jgi:DNA (cytosine-5)-methyltransferase 1